MLKVFEKDYKREFPASGTIPGAPDSVSSDFSQNQVLPDYKCPWP